MQLYLSRKIEYLKSIGWTTLVFYYTKGDVMIPNLRQYEADYIPSLRMAVGNVSRKERNRVISIINTKITNFNGFIIESFTPTLGTWGEYIASKFEGKHILYIINESIASPTKQMKLFLEYKNKQKLLYSIKKEILEKWLPTLINSYDVELKAVGCIANDIMNVDNELINNISMDGKTILSLGRLGKPYIKHLFESIASFVKRYNNINFNLLIIGDTPNENLKNSLFDIFKGISNIRLLALGSLWPLPRNVFEKSDIALGSAGSIRLCSEQGIPSVSIDSNDFEAIGIVGFNTDNITFRDENDSKNTIIDWLKYILIDNKISKKKVIDNISELDYSGHKKIIDEGFSKEYYPTQNSIYFVSHPHVRSLIIRLDQSKIGNRILKKILVNKRVQALVASIYNKK